MVKVMTESTDGRHRIVCSGHATGSEQVCAAVSGLVTALAGYLVNKNQNGILKLDMESGNCDIEFEGADEAFEMTKIGLLQISESYKAYFVIDL